MSDPALTEKGDTGGGGLSAPAVVGVTIAAGSTAAFGAAGGALVALAIGEPAGKGAIIGAGAGALGILGSIALSAILARFSV